jgi:hypothetical protein
MTTFRPHLNNVSTTLFSAHASGSGSLSLAPATGSKFGSTFPFTVTVITAATYGSPAETLTVFNVTGRTTDTLTGCTAIEGTTDQAFSVGDRVEMRWTNALATAIEGAVNGVENSTGITAGVIAPARLGGLGTPSNTTWLRGDGAWTPQWPGVLSKSTNYTMLATDRVIFADPTSGSWTLTLPAASAAQGNEYLVTNPAAHATNTVTIQRQGSDGVNNGISVVLSCVTQFKFVRLLCVSPSNFVVVGSG